MRLAAQLSLAIAVRKVNTADHKTPVAHTALNLASSQDWPLPSLAYLGPTLLGGIEDLRERLPPGRAVRLAARGARHNRLLPAVGHLPPLADPGVLLHALHISTVIISDVLEGGEEDARLLVVEYTVCFSQRILAYI